MTSVDNVRVLLQSLPAGVAQNQHNESASSTPAKVNALASATPTTTATLLRARNALQAPPQVYGTPEKSSGGKQMSALKAPEEFWRDLHQFHERRGTPLTQAAKISGQQVDLYKLYNEVTERGGFNKVNMRDEWDEVYSALETLRERCVNGTAGIKHIYRRYLDKYERLHFLGEDPDKMEALEAAIESSELGGGGRSRMRASLAAGGSGLALGLGSIFGAHHSTLTAVPMAYNQRQHNVNLERRRQHKLSTDLHRHSSYEKLLLSLLSPLPNEQDFAINVCTLMSNEKKLRLPECPKLLDALLAHLGVYADYTMRQLFQHGYTQVRRQSQLSFWRDLLHDKPQILELHKDEQAWLDNGLISKAEEENQSNQSEQSLRDALLADCDELDFLNLRRGDGTGDYMGQRVLQVVQIMHSLSFHEENLNVLTRNRTLWRYLVMGANVRWSNIHIQALETAGNLAQEFELLDPATDELSRNLLATLCEGIESADRAVIINCLEILYKLCAKEGNGAHINRCLGGDFYHRVMLLLSLTDVMLLIFTLETIYALTSLGARPCSMLMQVRGIIDQLVALLTVEAQSYGPDGCILMRVVELVPGNMLPMVAQNMGSLQAAVAAPPVLAKPVQLQVLQAPLQLPPTPAQTQVVLPHLVEQPAPLPILPLPMPSLPQVQLPPGVVASATPNPAAVRLMLPAPPSAPQSFTHDDEQYALAWLGATYERTAGQDCRVEQQELYRIYLSHCQKAGKHSVVNHMQFPRLVRLIFNQTVGPVIVRQLDGTELPGSHYVGIRMRAQPLTLQLQQQKQPMVITAPPPISAKKELATKLETELEETVLPTPVTTSTPSSSLIKSLLANKVTERQQKQKALVTQSLQNAQPPSLVATTASGSTSVTAQPIKVTSTAISAFVNNPLMPVKVGQTTIKPLHPPIPQKVVLTSDSAPPPLAPLSGANVMTKDASGRTLIITAGQGGNSALKRKLTIDEEQVKRLALDSAKEEPQVTPSKNAANLYADLAASILEDEDMDDVPPLTSTSQESQQQQQQQQQQQYNTMPAKLHAGGLATSAQRQLVFPGGVGVGGPPQLKLATTATIKTDQGMQTVPVILQQTPAQPSGAAPTGQQTTTQYVLATNQQGQTYLVAQQTQQPAVAPPPPPATQTLLVTQSPQQPGGAKTIIILQQPGGAAGLAGSSGTQKMLMTTAQGQQVLVTTTTAPQQQQQQQQPQQIFINSQRPAPTVASQMSPSLLSQLNQIPATIKLHQPQQQPNQQQQQRLGKATTQATVSALPIPQLQQHQSIIQQHLISGPSEKRQMLLSGGGRTIEIKETTLITQTPAAAPPLQQSQLNSQTIITTQPTAAGGGVNVRSVLEQQPQHPSIIQQKISVPAAPATLLSTQVTETIAPKPTLLAKANPTAIVSNVAKKQQPAPTKPIPTPVSESAKLADPIKAVESTTITTTSTTAAATATAVTSSTTALTPTANAAASTVPVDVNWLFICDWRNCPRRKFKSLNELQHHVCSVHCPENLDAGAELYCQWGTGPKLCDNVPRKLYSLMTHLLDRHLTPDSLKASVQRRLATGIHNLAPAQPAVHIVRVEPAAGAAVPTTTGGSGMVAAAAAASPFTNRALQAIKKHTMDFINPKELMDENEGPVTKSIRLTAALILRNLVSNTAQAKRSLKRHEPHLANVALSNVEASGALAHILYELSQ